MTHSPSYLGRRISLALVGALVLLAGLVPNASFAATAVDQSYVVLLKGGYALDGSYALGQGYALVGQETDYALDGTYALGKQYALYALDDVYALLDQYALDHQGDTYRAFGDYALYALDGEGQGYALDVDYALGEGYALAQQAGSYALDSSYALADDAAGYALGDNYALLDAYALDENYALARDYALAIISEAGGVITADLTRQIGVMVVSSKNSTFAQVLSQYALVKEVGNDFSEKHFPSLSEALNSGQLVYATPDANEPAGYDPLEDQQWGMKMINARGAQARQAGRAKVRVGVVDSGVDGSHQDFKDANGKSNIDCQHGADFTTDGPGVGNPLACVDNGFHGTHVAGIIAARRNGVGVVGVAPNVTIVPIKVCDSTGYCYVSDVVQGLTYAGDLKLNVINMSFFVDDDTFNESTEFKCQSDATQRAYVESVERALKYARSQGVSLISALGNSDQNLANPPGGANCKTIPAMSPGVTGTVALGPDSTKSSYSSWGKGFADVAAPGGAGTTGNCLNTILSTIPGGWGCFQGTSMASPHSVGVAALIISQFGHNQNGRWVMSPDKVAKILQSTAVDIGKKGYDKCYGYGRIDALRAVKNDTRYRRDTSATACSDY